MECRLDTATVHYEVRGSGKPIVMLHGFSPDHRLMAGCMEPVFAERDGWQRIYIDLPGMGLTKGEDWINSSDDMLAVIEQFLDTTIPGQSFLLAGESYGGYLSRGLLAKRPELVEGMLLICPLIEPDTAKRDLPPFRVLARDESFLAELQHEQAEEFTSIAVVQDRYNWERFEDEILSGLQLADFSFLQRIKQRYGFTFQLEPFSRPFEKPVLILAGRQDHIVGYRDQCKIADYYPRASIAVLDRAGHNLQIEQSPLFTALVHE